MGKMNYDSSLRSSTSDADVDDIQIWTYVITGVFGFVLLVLIACVIALFVLVKKLSSRQKALERERDEERTFQDYKISRPKITRGNNYQRFTLPSKLENDSNSDVFFGGGMSNSSSGLGRNPLSHSGLNRQKSFNYEGDAPNTNRYSANPLQNYQNPSSDYHNISDRSKFTY